MSDMTFTLVFILICLLIDWYRERKEMKWSDDMADREKVIEELHDARRYLEGKEWSDRGASPHIDAINDALALLKEQDKQKFFVDENGKITPLPVVVRCKDCKHVCFCDTTEILPNIPVYAECTITHEVHNPDWFCADGKRDK